MLNGDDSGLYGLQGGFGGKKTVDRIAQLLIKAFSFSFFCLRDCFCCVCVFIFHYQRVFYYHGVYFRCLLCIIDKHAILHLDHS